MNKPPVQHGFIKSWQGSDLAAQNHCPVYMACGHCGINRAYGSKCGDVNYPCFIFFLHPLYADRMVSLCFLGSATYSQCGKRRGCDFLRIVFGLCDPRHPTFSQLPGRTYIPFRNQLPFEFYYIRVHEQKQGWICKYFENYLRVWTRSETLFLYTHPFNNLLIAYNDRRLGREGVAAYWCSKNIFAYNAYLCIHGVDRYCRNCVQ